MKKLSPSANHQPVDLKPKKIILKFRNMAGQIRRITLGCKHDHASSDDDDNNNNNSHGHGSSWVRGPLLGKGGFASVFLAQLNRDIDIIDSPNSDHLLLGDLIALKSSFFEDSSTLQFEKKVFADLNACPNVVQCYGQEITKTPSGTQVYNLLLEYCSGDSLHDRISTNGCLPESEVRRYARDIVYGIASIHASGYIHCDIKPENILLTPGVDSYGGHCLVAKIADFGLAMKMTNVVTIDDDHIRGTTEYMAPEIWKDSYIDWPVDIWALGCVVFEMLTGTRVWNFRTSEPDLNIHSNEFQNILRGLSRIAIDFLRRCLLHNLYKRSSAWLLLDHPFICNFDDGF